MDPYVDQRLKEWARWARQRKWLSSCGSAEKHYLPESGEVWGSDEDKPVPVSVLDAWRVEVAWRTYLPMNERIVLRAHYITGPTRSSNAWAWHIRRTCRDLGLRPHQWGEYVSSAARKIEPYLGTLQPQDLAL